MSRIHTATLALLFFASHSAAQVPVNREAMWPAASAEDWKRPCLVTWQRSFEDAVAVSRETGKAILVCVNMDGEIASEHYAGVRYRDPAIAVLFEPYVCVIASVYRHTPRDFDERGQRVLCPRFGTVTCGEHISIEPGLFDQYFEGQRVAPRHIMVELDGRETYDVYYAFDTDSVFRSIREGIANRPAPPSPPGAERSLVERVASRDVADREALEEAYLVGDKTLRRTLVRAAIEAGEAEPFGILRLAVFDLDVELNRLAREALANATSEGAIDLILEALRVPLDAEERDTLIAALERIGESSDRARTLASVHRGLARRSSALDVEGWSKAFSESSEPVVATELAVLESRLEYQAEASTLRPEDATTFLELAEASLAFGVDPKSVSVFATDRATAAQYAKLHFEDARRAARKAEELGASGWRLDAAAGIAAYYLGELSEAHERVERAVQELPSGAADWNAMAVLELFADGRKKAIAKAVREKREWPREWISDVHATHAILADHPLGSDAHVAGHHDFLVWFGAPGQAERVLDAGLERFPDSWALHTRLRSRVLRARGVQGLETAYAERMARSDSSPNIVWYAGYAALVEAEYRRRAGEPEQALEAYGRGIALYERAIEANPEGRDSCDHYIALALAGRSRLAFERGDHEKAVAQLLASLERRAQAAASLDGLGLSAVATAQMILARLVEEEREELAETVRAALDALDPELLELPAFERQGPRTRAGRRPR